MSKAKNTILFLCTGNSCRSQMAEGWMRKFWGDQFEVFSAGIKKHGMNPRAVEVMAEAGVDLSTHSSKTTDELPSVPFDFVVTVCDSAQENCPYYPGGRLLHQSFDDPPGLTRDMTEEGEILPIYRRVRDEIKEYILELPQKLEA